MVCLREAEPFEEIDYFKIVFLLKQQQKHAILIPRDRVSFCQHQESRQRRGSNFRSMRRIIVRYSQPIRFEHPLRGKYLVK